MEYIVGKVLLGFILWLLADVIKTYIKCKYKHNKNPEDDVSMYTRDDRRYNVQDRFK